MPETAKYCNHCGKPVHTNTAGSLSPEEEPRAKSSGQPPIELFVGKISLFGKFSESVKRGFCEILGTKTFEGTQCSVCGNQSGLLVTPYSKDRPLLKWAGVLLMGEGAAGAALGGIARAGLEAIDKSLSKSQSESILKNKHDFLAFDLENLTIEAYESKSGDDIFGGDWLTSLRFAGTGNFGEERGEISVVIKVPGPTFDKNWLNKSNGFVKKFSETVGRPMPSIETLKKPRHFS